MALRDFTYNPDPAFSDWLRQFGYNVQSDDDYTRYFDESGARLAQNQLEQLFQNYQSGQAVDPSGQSVFGTAGNVAQADNPYATTGGIVDIGGERYAQLGYDQTYANDPNVTYDPTYGYIAPEQWAVNMARRDDNFWDGIGPFALALGGLGAVTMGPALAAGLGGETAGAGAVTFGTEMTPVLSSGAVAGTGGPSLTGLAAGLPASWENLIPGITGATGITPSGAGTATTGLTDAMGQAGGFGNLGGPATTSGGAGTANEWLANLLGISPGAVDALGIGGSALLGYLQAGDQQDAANQQFNTWMNEVVRPGLGAYDATFAQGATLPGLDPLYQSVIDSGARSAASAAAAQYGDPTIPGAQADIQNYLMGQYGMPWTFNMRGQHLQRAGLGVSPAAGQGQNMVNLAGGQYAPIAAGLGGLTAPSNNFSDLAKQLANFGINLGGIKL